MNDQKSYFTIKTVKSYVFTSLLILIASNCFSQWKTAEANNIKNDIIITYEIIYDRELSAEEKKSSDFLNDITVAFNKDKMTERRFGSKMTTNFSLFDYKTLKAYSCMVTEKNKEAIQYNFKEPTVAVETIKNVEPKMIFDFPCEKGLVMINNKSKDIFYTKKIGLRYCYQFKIDGFLMEYPGYSKTLGYYTVKAKKVVYDDLPKSYYSLDNFNVQTEEEYKKNKQESAEKWSKIRMENIGKKAATLKELSLKNEKIDSKKMLGDVIVYNFWFTTCPPCKMEIPKLNQLKEKYKDKNVHFIAVALDPEYKLNSYLKTTPLYYDIIFSDGKPIADDFGITGYPTNIIVDKKGIIQFYDAGYKPDIVERMSFKIDEYLAQ